TLVDPVHLGEIRALAGLEVGVDRGTERDVHANTRGCPTDGAKSPDPRLASFSRVQAAPDHRRPRTVTQLAMTLGARHPIKSSPATPGTPRTRTPARGSPSPDPRRPCSLPVPGPCRGTSAPWRRRATRAAGTRRAGPSRSPAT